MTIVASKRNGNKNKFIKTILKLGLFFLFLRQLLPGGHGGEEIPVPIPNTEVKLPCADDTAYQAGK